jgi:ankyrin repeat protein
MVELLLSYRANTESRLNVGGETALHLACGTGNEPIVKVLVEGGADINATLNDGSTCLMIAALRGQAAASIPVIGFLLEHGVNLEAKDDKGSTVLNRVCATNRAHISKILVEQGANVNARDNDGNTALMNVILSQGVDLPKKILNVQLLCGNGADLSIENRAHQTARDLAAIHLPGMVSLLDRFTGARGRNLLAVEQTLGSHGSPLPVNVAARVAEFSSGKRGPLSAQKASLRRNTLSNNERRRRNRWNRIVGELPNAPPGTSLFEGGRRRKRKTRRRR